VCAARCDGLMLATLGRDASERNLRHCVNGSRAAVVAHELGAIAGWRYGLPKSGGAHLAPEKDRTELTDKSDNGRSNRGAKCRRACVRRAPHRTLDREPL
jgi:hypothetical protein